MGHMDTASPADSRFQRNGSKPSPGQYETEHAKNNVKNEFTREANLKLTSAAFVKCDNKTVWPLEPTYAVLCGVFVSSVFHERSTSNPCL